jgi:hypothetical protein
MRMDRIPIWGRFGRWSVVAENSRYERPYILFADFLIDSHFYCFRYESQENVRCLHRLRER